MGERVDMRASLERSSGYCQLTVSTQRRHGYRCCCLSQTSFFLWYRRRRIRFSVCKKKLHVRLVSCKIWYQTLWTLPRGLYTRRLICTHVSCWKTHDMIKWLINGSIRNILILILLLLGSQVQRSELLRLCDDIMLVIVIFNPMDILKL